MEPVTISTEESEEKSQKALPNPLFPFLGIGSLVYAFFYTLFLYRNSSGITYPFFAGGTCLLFFFYLKRCGLTAKKSTVFITLSIILLGISTCMTDSWILIFLNKAGIFCLFFYLVLHNLYEDKNWDLPKYTGSVLNITFSSFLYLLRPFTDYATFSKSRREGLQKKDGKVKYVVIGFLFALPLLLVILVLLSGADAVFKEIVNNILLFDIDFDEHIWGISFLFLFAFFASYSVMSRISNHNLKEEVPDKRTAEPVIGITFTGLISFVYLIFCLIQIVYLFGGFGTLPGNYTYARYAREGFFQLVFVCLINLTLILVCRKRFRESRLLNGILTFICLCTYIMIASSAYRMILYIQAYCLTFLRMFVLWALLVIFFLVTGALICLYRKEFPLVKHCVVTVTMLYLAFSFFHPDHWIAKYNLEHIAAAQKGSGFDDYAYLTRLSMDAAPVIFQKADELKYGGSKSQYWFENYAFQIHLSDKMSIRNFNFSRWTAYNVYTDYYRKHKGDAD